jgi:4-amino-4-deoxy-L-arabinose transferase-like glycosyltransferase
MAHERHRQPRPRQPDCGVRTGIAARALRLRWSGTTTRRGDPQARRDLHPGQGIDHSHGKHRIISDDGSTNHYVYQAQAFLRGQTHIEEFLNDLAIFEDRFYIQVPPFPAVLLVPAVAILGVNATYTTLIAALISVLAIFIFIQILKKLEIAPEARFWLVLATFLGLGFWSAVLESSGVWYFAHVIAFTSMLLAINEALGKGRDWLVGLFLGMALLSRQLSVLSAIFLVVAIWKTPTSEIRGRNVANLIGFALVAGLFGAAYLYFNWLRFRNPFEGGYTYVDLPIFLRQRIDQYGLLSWRYVPFNFSYLFLQGFHIQFDEFVNPMQGFHVDTFGTSLVFASPFLMAAFFAKWERRLIWAAWLTVALTTVYLLFWHNNGWVQFNTQRYTLDFMPVLLVLVALGTKQAEGRWWQYAIIYAIALNILALVLIPYFPYVREGIRWGICNIFGAAPWPCASPPYAPPPLFQ